MKPRSLTGSAAGRRSPTTSSRGAGSCRPGGQAGYLPSPGLIPSCPPRPGNSGRLECGKPTPSAAGVWFFGKVRNVCPTSAPVGGQAHYVVLARLRSGHVDEVAPRGEIGAVRRLDSHMEEEFMRDQRESSAPAPIAPVAPGEFAAAEPLPDLIRRIVREELRPIYLLLEEQNARNAGARHGVGPEP